MNPIEIFYCWQAILLALIVYMMTQLVKVGVTARLANKWDVTNPKRAWFLKRIFMPALPPILGFLGAASIPMRPEVLIEYVTTHEILPQMATLVYGAWGAAIGQFADYMRTKIWSAIQDRPVTPS